MKFILLLVPCLCLCLPSAASAEEPSSDTLTLEAWTDVGATIAFRRKWGARLQGRWALKEGARDALEAGAGITRKLWGHSAVHLVAGYARGHEPHAFAVTLIKEASFGSSWRTFGYASEQRLRFDGNKTSYEGFYRLDAVIAGVHAVHYGTDDVALGFQIGTGPGYRQARVEARFSFAVRGHLPDRVGTFALLFDLP